MLLLTPVPDLRRDYTMSKMNTFVRSFDPQTLIEVCRFRNWYQNPIPDTSAGGHEFHVKFELNMRNSNHNYMIKEPVETVYDTGISKLTERKHDRINELIHQLQSINNLLSCTKASKDNVSPIQIVDGNLTADINCVETKDVRMKFQRKGLMRSGKFSSKKVTAEENSFALRCDIFNGSSDGKTQNLTTKVLNNSYVLNLETQIYIKEKDIYILDCKLQVKCFVERVQTWMYTVGLEENTHERNMMSGQAYQMEQTMKLEFDNEIKEETCTELKKMANQSSVIQEKQERDSLIYKDKNEKQHESPIWFFWFHYAKVSSLMLMISLTVFLPRASALYFEEPVAKKLLTSKTCSIDNFYSLKSKCHTDEIAHDLTLYNCQFQELCKTDEVPVCLDTENMGVYICLKRGLSCQKGRMVIARQNNELKDVIHVQEVDCPKGTYQPTESDCIHACSYKHRDVDAMDDRYLLSSVGDNKSPTYAFCNFKSGYYSPDGKLTFDYDQDPFLNPYLCVNDHNCGNGQYPLPDGLCVNKCDYRFERNPPDFHCRKIGTVEHISSTTAGNNIAQKTPPMSSTQSSTEGIYSTVLTFTSGVTNDVKDKNDEKTSTIEGAPWWHYLLYCLPVLVISIGIIACIYHRKCVLKWLKKRPFCCESHKHVTNKHGNLTYKIEGKTVNFNHYGKWPGIADSLIGEETIV